MIDASLIFDGTLSYIPGVGPSGVALTTTRVSTNVIDLLTGRDLGAGNILGIHVDVLTTFTAGGAATLQIDFEVGATAGGTYYPLNYSSVIPVAQLTVGSPIFRVALPLNQVLNAVAGVRNTPGRFIRLNYTVATGPFTAGTIFSYVNPIADRQQYFDYPINYTA